MTDMTGDAQAEYESQSNRIVVGHDGSSGAHIALKMALKLADRLQASGLIVRAWSMATAPRRPDWEFGYVPSFDEMSAAVHDHLLNDTATDVARFTHLPVEHRTVHASPARSLVDLSSGALMLVVGSRGLGGFAGLVLGAVSEQCVRHAACPVLVVRRLPLIGGS
jgi:nucleotide-binding universal stress UspA family protein